MNLAKLKILAATAGMDLIAAVRTTGGPDVSPLAAALEHYRQAWAILVKVSHSS